MGNYYGTENLLVNIPDQVFFASLANILYQNLDNEAVSTEIISKQIGISHSVVYKKIELLTGTFG